MILARLISKHTFTWLIVSIAVTGLFGACEGESSVVQPIHSANHSWIGTTQGLFPDTVYMSYVEKGTTESGLEIEVIIDLGTIHESVWTVKGLIFENTFAFSGPESDFTPWFYGTFGSEIKGLFIIFRDHETFYRRDMVFRLDVP